MPVYKCPKCQKVYPNKGKYYQNHIKSCSGEKIISKTKTKAKITQKKTSENTILRRLDDMEKRISLLEQNLRKINVNFVSDGRNKANLLLPLSNDQEAIQIIKSIINENSNIYSIKDVIPLQDLRNLLKNHYNFTQDQFENLILRLYRKQIVDLQAGGTSKDYQLRSPTGKDFYYLILKYR